MKVSIQELLVVFIVALVIIGPDKLPMYAKKLGMALAQFRKFSADATKDIKESIVEPLEEAQRPLREAIEPITELEESVKSNVKEIQQSFADIGKPKKTSDSSSEKEKPDVSSGEPEASVKEKQDASSGEPKASVKEKQDVSSGEPEAFVKEEQDVSSEEPMRSETDKQQDISFAKQDISDENPEKAAVS